MVYITGDTHADFSRYTDFAEKVKPGSGDTMIVLGDAGLNFFGGKKDFYHKKFVNDFPFKTFCVHGNHEMRPTDVPTYIEGEYHGGMVWYEKEFPNILFAKDGEIYDFEGCSCIVIGGAYSIDKFYRLMNDWRWFSNEQPSAEIKAYVEKQLKARDNRVDIVFSHTCPMKYVPYEAFIRGIDQSSIDKSTEEWLDKIEDSLDYKKWYCGHFHICKRTDRMQFMFKDIEMLKII